MKTSVCLILLIFMCSLGFNDSKSSSTKEEGNTFEKSDSDMLFPLLFLLSGAPPTQSAASPTLLFSLVATGGIVAWSGLRLN